MVLTVIWQSSAQAGEHYQPVSVAPSADFDSLKKLAGTWEGVMFEKNGEKTPAKVQYKLTSGGSALVEILSPGEPHEMESVYFNRNGKLTMTHYCLLGNRPTLALQSSGKGEYFLDLAEGSGIDTLEPHMHSLKITMPDADTPRQEWTYYQDGQAQGLTTFELKRVK